MDAKDRLWELVSQHREWFEDQLEWSDEDAGDEWVVLTGVLELLNEARARPA